MCHNGAFAVWFLHSKKGGKIQTGLNCEVDSLSKACLWLAYSNITSSFSVLKKIVGAVWELPARVG